MRRMETAALRARPDPVTVETAKTILRSACHGATGSPHHLDGKTFHLAIASAQRKIERAGTHRTFRALDLHSLFSFQL